MAMSQGSPRNTITGVPQALPPTSGLIWKRREFSTDAQGKWRKKQWQQESVFWNFGHPFEDVWMQQNKNIDGRVSGWTKPIEQCVQVKLDNFLG